jgi:arylsulfatase A-like enzyme
VDRREFLKAAVAAPLAAPFVTRGRRGAADKPNLLFLWADQQRPDTMKVYGNTKVQAPNFNRLAGESVVFANPYATQPICTPSRACVMTGLWPHTTGCLTNNIPLPATVPAFPELLADSSYRTGYFGKWHLGDELHAQHGFEEWVSIEDGYDVTYKAGGEKERSSYDQFLRSHGYQPDQKGDKFSREFAAALPVEMGKPRFLRDHAVDFLRRHRGEPFVLYVNFLEPHPPYDGPFDHLYQPDRIELPPNFGIPPAEGEPLAYRAKSVYDRNIKFPGMDLGTEAGWRRAIANYYGNITHIDGAVGGILDTLEELGLADHTIVVHTADHGEMLGAHGIGQKEVMYEEAVKVPWLMRIPSLGRKQRLIKGRFSHIDLVPTLLDLMGREADDRLPGKSLQDVMRGSSRRENVYIEWSPGDTKIGPIPGVSEDEVRKAIMAHTRTVITPDGWKLCLSDADRHQLFNLERDPWEMHNLFYSGGHDDVVGRLTQQIHNWQRNVNDVVVVDRGK